MSAGPFRSVPNAPGAETGPDGRDTYTFEAFPQFHRGYPTIDRVDLKVFPNARNAWAAMMRGEIDMLYEVAPDALDFIEQSSNTQVRSFLRPYVFTMGLNVKHPVLADRDVRRALNMAVNRTEIIKRVFRDHAYPATDHVWPRHWAYDHELPRLRYDPAKAIELLEAKGLRIPPATGANRAARTRDAEPVPLHLPDPRRRHAVRAHGPAAPASARRGRHRHAHRSGAGRRAHAAPARPGSSTRSSST